MIARPAFSASRRRARSAPGSPWVVLFSRFANLNRRASRLIEAYEDIADEFRGLLPGVSSGGPIGSGRKGGRSGGRFDQGIARRPMVIARIHTAAAHDGSLAVALDHYDPIPVSGFQAELLLALSRDVGQPADESDPLVSFKTAAMLLEILNERRAKAVTRRGLVVAISRLRQHLARWFPDGASLVQTKRGVGWRLALIRPGPRRQPR